MSAIIKADNLGKRYVLSHREQERYLALRDVMARSVRTLGQKLRHPFAPHRQTVTREDFWALKDISFEIGQGDRVGIIGRNGAGKSTLLKILSRITEPSAGRVAINGRVASLLEVGTGFHPELTGRENIFLNGAILGMSRAEISRKFDEIVDFAEVERFLDTPVKRYSSGMYVRLAFAVAAHLEPEILVVDEVLAVGDLQFQKKCLGKMQDVGKEGRTVLFVSHNMQAIRQLCDRAIMLKSGTLQHDGEVGETIDVYLREGYAGDGEPRLVEAIDALPADPSFRLERITLRQEGAAVGQFVENGKPLEVEVGFRVLEKTTGLRVYIDLYDDQETLLFRTFHDENNDGIPTVEPGQYNATVLIPDNLLAPLRYELRVQAGIFNVRNCIPAPGIALPIQVENTGRYNRAYLGDSFRGKLAPVMEWHTERLE